MLKDKKLFLFDIDGTIAVGDTLYPDSKALLDYLDSIGAKACYITNNSTRSGQDYVRKFSSCFGLNTTQEQFITSGYMTLRFLQEHYAGRKIFVLGTASFVRELQNSGLYVTQKPEPDIACAVAAYDSELTYGKLTDICLVLSTMEIPFYATNPDLCCPVDFGFVPDCGAICEMITHATGKKPVYLGKPNADVVRLCMAHSGFCAEETLVVGDRLYTDIACGINAGVDTCVVLTGEARREDLKDTDWPPTWVFDSVTELLEAIKGE